MVRRNQTFTIPLTLVLGGLLGATGTALAGDQPSGPEVEKKVTQAIRNVDDAKVEDLQVYVEPNGTITVHGLVASSELEDRILDVARRNGGGEVVHDQLAVVNKGQQVTGR